jgi:hypothetical protein
MHLPIFGGRRAVKPQPIPRSPAAAGRFAVGVLPMSKNVLLILSAAITATLPARAGAENAAVMAGNVKIENHSRDPRVVDALVSALPAFQAKVDELVERRNPFRMLENADAASFVVDKFRSAAGDSIDPGKTLAAFKGAVANYDRTSVESGRLRGVLVYDAAELKGRLRAGQTVPFFSYEKNGDAASFSWTEAKARQLGDQPYFPLLILVMGDPPEETVKKAINRHYATLEVLLEENYTTPLLSVLMTTAEAVIQPGPNCRRWVRFGLAESLAVRVATELTSIKRGADAFDRAFVAGASKPLESLDLDGWAAGGDMSTNAAHVRQATQIFREIIRVKGTKWIPGFLQEMRNAGEGATYEILSKHTGLRISAGDLKEAARDPAAYVARLSAEPARK